MRSPCRSDRQDTLAGGRPRSRQSTAGCVRRLERKAFGEQEGSAALSLVRSAAGRAGEELLGLFLLQEQSFFSRETVTS